MKATLTNLIDVLWRWRRGIARAVLLAGALAGVGLGTVTHAQVAFRSASSATQPVPTFRAASSAIQAAPPAPAFQAAGAAVQGQAAVTPAWPAHEIGDVALLFIESAGGEVATLSTAAGFAAVANSPQATGATTNGTRITVFWARATSTAMASPTVADPGNHVYARILTYRGVFASGNPWDVTGGGVKAAASTTVTVTGVTTTVANTLVVQAVARDNDNAGAAFSAQTNGNLTGITEQSDAGTTQGNGGGIGVWDGVKATAGGTGNTAATVTNSINAFLTIALRPPTSALTITRPAGTIQNDVMIASFGFRTNQPGLSTDVVITPPAGWTLVRRLDNPGGGNTDNGLAVYQRVAGAAEPANYRWGLTCIATCATNGFQAAAGGIASFSNVNTTTPVDAENGQNTVAGAQTAPSVTTTVANAMLVAAHSYATAGPWTPPAASGGDAAMTEAVDILSGAQSTEMSYVLHAAAGATAAKQATPAPDDDAGNAHILALRPVLQSTLTINKPAGTIQNDVMIASIGFSPNTLTITTVPAGWTLVRRVDNTNANANSLAVYRKVAGAAEPASYAWIFSAAGYLAGGISTFSGVDTTTPVDIENGNCTQQGSCATATLTHRASAVTTTVTNTMVVSSHTYSSAGTWAAPGGMTEAVDVQHGNQSLEMNYVLQAAAGSTGNKDATASTQADVGNAHILALQPAAVVVPTPGSFNAFETSTAPNPGAITGQIYTKLVSTNFSLDVVAILSGAQHSTFTDTVQVDLVTGAAGGLNCPGTPVSIAGPQSVNLTSGRGTTGIFNVASAFPDVRVRVRYPVASPTVTSCSTDNLSIRPTAFTVTSTNATQTGSSGTPAIKTGANFNLTAASVAGYNGTPGIDNTKVVGTPTAGAIGGSFGAANPVSGTATGAGFFYSEVGNFGLNGDAVRDTAFTSVDQGPGDCIASSTSNTLSGGKYGCWVGSSAVAQTTGVSGFGRFIPDNFNVTYTTAPIFSTVCGTFTYVGTRFTYPSAAMTVTARNGTNNGLTNATTTNYAGSYMKLSNAAGTSLNQAPYDTQLGRYARFDALGGGATPALDTSALPVTTADPTIGTFTNGVGTLTFGSGTGLAFTRSTTTPNAPFNADIALALNVIDTDSVVFAGNPAAFGTATSGGGISFSSGKPMRFGRLAIRNANGSQLVPLPVQVEAQYWGYTNPPTNTVLGFITNTADSCTAIASANDAMGNYTSNLSGSPTCETAISGGGTLSAGRRTLQLAAPGGGNNGSVDLTVNLGASASGNTCTTLGGAPVSATTANQPHLQGNWTGGAYNVNPSARATFGVYKGAEEIIFVRENF